MKRAPMVKTVIMNCLIVSMAAHLWAAEVEFEIALERNQLTLGSSTQLKLIFHNNQNIPAPELKRIDGLEIRYLGPSTMMSFVNGKMSSSVTHSYALVAHKEGTYQIGPYSFQHKKNTYKAAAVTITVTDRPARQQTSQHTAPPRGARQDQGKTSIDDYVFLTMEVDKKKAYVNEIMPLTIKLYVDRFRIRDIQYPEFSHEGFSVGDFIKPRQYQQRINDVIYDVVEFRTNTFGTRSGTLTLGPAELACNLLVKKQGRRRRGSTFDDFFTDSFFDGFFGNYEVRPLRVQSPAVTMTMLALPEEGKPAHFKGAVGTFDFTLAAQPKEVHVGDPITLTMGITGQGNLSTIVAPVLASEEGFKVYDAHVEQQKNTKTFEQIILPTSERVKKIPPISFSFFDTAKGTYKTITKGPIPVTVTKSDKDGPLTIIEMPQDATRPVVREVLGRDIIYIKQSPGHLQRAGRYLYRTKWYLFFHIIPVVFLTSAFIFLKRKERLETDVRFARRLRAPKEARKGIQEAHSLLHKGKRKEFYDTVFKTLQEYLGNKFHLATGGITGEVVDSILREKNIDASLLTMIKDIFNVCDVARYAASELDRGENDAAFTKLKTIIDYLERHKL